eukprot:TRINITY_DN20521_c0_g2_i1.p1 TRINITY_DN20521_c0_g2~~TRINITY_DN20521_c0_g2_i1.p1  ORF type:complete len:376 (+),score=78.96 TRINITY_DN20521_c0_g2_i1:224-1351(+)
MEQNRRCRFLLQSVSAAELPGIDEWHSQMLESKEMRGHLRWMQQKYRLGQDMCLIGGFGPLRRWLAMRFCEANKLELEYVALTRDTTDCDLKQRREIDEQGAVVWQDLPAVRAAIFGRVLILEGLEKAERNVLPVLNNLLENREMSLDDGRFLMDAARYDKLGSSPGKHIIRVHPGFRVIALTVPVPPFPGNPIDPPLRSRFQGRVISPLDPPALRTVMNRAMASISRRAPPSTHTAHLLAVAGAIKELTQDPEIGLQVPQLTESSLLAAARTACLFPKIAPSECLDRVYPWEGVVFVPETVETVKAILDAIASSQGNSTSQPYQLTSLSLTPDHSRMLRPTWQPTSGIEAALMCCGSGSRREPSSFLAGPLALT